MIRFAAALALTLVAGSALAADVHPALDGVHGYAPRAAISETAGAKHVAGYFETRGEACAMTLVVSEKDDETLEVAPIRIAFQVPAADVAEIATGEGSAIRVACTVDADQVKIATFPARSM